MARIEHYPVADGNGVLDEDEQPGNHILHQLQRVGGRVAVDQALDFLGGAVGAQAPGIHQVSVQVQLLSGAAQAVGLPSSPPCNSGSGSAGCCSVGAVSAANKWVLSR